MANPSSANLDTYVKRTNPEDPVKKLNSVSLSTTYPSDSGELEHSQSIDDVPDTPGTVGRQASENETCRETGYSELLSELELRVKRLEQGLQMANSLNEIFSELCNIETLYAQRLRTLKDRVDLRPILDSVASVSVLSAFKSYLTKVAENHNDFMDAVASECYLGPKPTELAELTAEIAKLRRELSSYRADRLQCLERMRRAYARAKDAVSLCLDATHQAPAIKTSVHKTLIPLVLDFVEVNNMAARYDEFNYFLDFSRRLDAVTSSVADVEAKRSLEISDIVSKFAVHETAKVRNLEYDLSSLLEAINGVDPASDTGLVAATKPKLPQNIATKYADLLEPPQPRPPAASIQPPPYRVISKIENDLQRFLDYIWGAGEAELGEFAGEIQSSLVRQIFCDMLSKKACSRCELESEERFETLVKVVNATLDVAERQADYWCGYSVLKFADKFRAGRGDAGGETRQLWAGIAAHSYWKNTAFWEECLTMAVSLDLKAAFETASCLEGPVAQIDCVASTEDAARFMGWMHRAGVPAAEGAALVDRVCRRLRLPQSYVSSLIQPAGRTVPFKSGLAATFDHDEHQRS